VEHGETGIICQVEIVHRQDDRAFLCHGGDKLIGGLSEPQSRRFALRGRGTGKSGILFANAGYQERQICESGRWRGGGSWGTHQVPD
jgi:hypothetical protein